MAPRADGDQEDIRSADGVHALRERHRDAGVRHVPQGLEGLEHRRRAAQNLPLTNFAICSAVSHMQNMSALDAAYAEAVLAGIVNTQPDARARLAAFADKTAARVRPNA